MEVNTSLNKYFEIIGLLYTYAHPDLDDKGIWDKVAKDTISAQTSFLEK